jgi:hypothetical protein
MNHNVLFNLYNFTDLDVFVGNARQCDLSAPSSGQNCPDESRLRRPKLRGRDREIDDFDVRLADNNRSSLMSISAGIRPRFGAIHLGRILWWAGSTGMAIMFYYYYCSFCAALRKYMV